MISWISRLRRKLYLKVPEWIRKRDFELFTAGACFLAGLGILIGGVDPNAMERELPTPVVLAWASVLTASPILIVLGVWLSHKHDFPRAIPWLRREALGLKLLAYSAYLYAIILVILVGSGAGASPFITAVFALTCHSRAAYLTIRVEDYFDLLEQVQKGALDDLG